MSPANRIRCDLVAVDPVAGGIVGVVLVKRRVEEVEPQPIRPRGSARRAGRRSRAGRFSYSSPSFTKTPSSDLPVGAARSKKSVTPRPGLAKRARLDDVDDRGRRDAGQRPGQRLVGAAEARGCRGGRRRRTGRPPPPAPGGRAPPGRRRRNAERRARCRPASRPIADQHAEQERHRQRQDDDPGKRQDASQADLAERRAAPDEEVRQRKIVRTRRMNV